MNCSNCGSPIEPGKKFCGECGQPVVVEPPPTEAPPPIPDDIPTQLAYEPTPPEEVWVLSRPGQEPIVLGESTLFGRGTECDYMLDDTQASRRHALIEKGEEGYTLTDQDSSNGTFVDEERLYGSVLLTEGDTIRIGQTTFTFEQLDEGDEGQARAAEPEPVVQKPAEPASPAEAVPPAAPPPPAEAPAEPIQAQAPERKFCPSCGAVLEPGIAFCGECGHQLPAEPVAGQPHEAVPDWDPIDSLAPQPIDRKLHFSRRGLLIGGGVILALLLSAICCAVVVSYVVEEIL